MLGRCRPLDAALLVTHCCCRWASGARRASSANPPAFRAAVRELLRISHKHGGMQQRGGQQWQLWGLNTRELQDLLLPVMGRGSMTAWAKL